MDNTETVDTAEEIAPEIIDSEVVESEAEETETTALATTVSDTQASDPQVLFDAIVRAFVEQGAFDDDAPVMLRAFLEELQEPGDELAAIVAQVREELDGPTLFELVAGIKRIALERKVVVHMLFRKHDAAKAFNYLASIEPAKLALAAAAEETPIEPAAESPAASDGITTEELLRERPLEWRATETRNLRVGLEEERVAELQNRLAHAFAEMSKLEDEKEDFDKAINKKIKSYRAECDIANLALKEGEEEAPVTCRWRYDYTNGIRDLIRLDTDEIVETQDLTVEERQARFEFEEGNASEPEPPRLYNHVRCNVCGWVQQVTPTSDLPADASCASCNSKAISLHGEPVTIEEPELEEPSGDSLADELDDAEEAAAQEDLEEVVDAEIETDETGELTDSEQEEGTTASDAEQEYDAAELASMELDEKLAAVEAAAADAETATQEDEEQA